LAAFLALCAGRASAEPVIYDNFDSYDEGTGIQGQGGWEPWDLAAPDATVSAEQSFSEPHSLRLQPGSDEVQVLAEVASGRWTARAMTYVPSTMGGDAYFILLNTYAHGGAKNWSTQVRFNVATVTSLGGSDFGRPPTSTRPTITDEWVEIRVEIDLDTNSQTIFYGGEPLDEAHTWQATGINEIQCMDLYSDTADGFYYDEVALHEQCTIVVEAAPTRGVAPLEVTFDASGSSCPEAALVGFSWDFGDGATGAGAMVTHTYTEAGVYRARVTILDEDDLSFTNSVLVGVGCPRTAIAPWSEAEIGTPIFPGCSGVAGDCVTVHGGGLGIGRAEEELHFVYQEIAGDFSVVARLRDVEWPLEAKAGILARESLDPASRYAYAAAWNRAAGVSARLDRRTSAGGSTSGRTVTPATPWAPPDVYLRLDRVGEVVTGYYSADGADWREISTATIRGTTPSMLVGLAGSPGDASATVEATFCEVSFGGGKMPVEFRRGDADGNGMLELTDGVFVLNFLFLGGPAPTCLEAADADDNGDLELTDGVYDLNYLFLGGPEPRAPGSMACGPDPEGSLDSGCEDYPSC
jgi:PKD repeat protein